MSRLDSYNIKTKYLINNWRKLTPGEIKGLSANISWFNLCRFEKLDDKFIEKFKCHIIWDALIGNPFMPQELIIKFRGNFNMSNVFYYYQIDEDLIMEHINEWIDCIPIILAYQQNIGSENRDTIMMLYELYK